MYIYIRISVKPADKELRMATLARKEVNSKSMHFPSVHPDSYNILPVPKFDLWHLELLQTSSCYRGKSS